MNIEELSRHCPESSIRKSIETIEVDLLRGLHDMLAAVIETQTTARRLVEAKSTWKDIKILLEDYSADYGVFDGTESKQDHAIRLLSDDYSFPEPQTLDHMSDLMLRDTLCLLFIFVECRRADTLPMPLVAMALARASYILSGLTVAEIATRKEGDRATPVLKAAEKQAQKWQPTVEAFYQVKDRADKKPYEIVNEIHDMTGQDKKTIRRYLTRAGELKFKGYE